MIFPGAFAPGIFILSCPGRKFFKTCFVMGNGYAPHFFFFWAQEGGTASAPSSFFEGRKKKSAPGWRRKKGLCIKLSLTALSFPDTATHRTFPNLIQGRHIVILFPLPLPRRKIDVQRNQCMQCRLRPGGESKRGGRGPLLGRWGEGFQRERRIETPRPLACLLSLSARSERDRRSGPRRPGSK